MGNVIKSKQGGFLEQWVVNYKPEQLNVGFLANNFNIKNLILDTDKINEELRKAHQPFELQFGLLSTLKLNISYMNLALELFEIDDLIIVQRSKSENVKFEREKYDEAAKEKHVLHMLKNKANLESKKGLVKNPLVDYAPMALPTPIANKIKSEGKPQKNPLIDANILGSEFYKILKNRLDYKIKIKNIRIFLECEQHVDSTGKKDDDHCTFEFVMNDVVLNSENINDYLDQEGNFKSWVNIKKLNENLHGGQGDLLYLATSLRHVALETYIGTQNILPEQKIKDIKNDLTNANEKQRETKLAQHIKYFSEINSRGQGTNLKIFQLDSLIIDTILSFSMSANLPPINVGGKEVPNPFNAILMNLNLKNVSSCVSPPIFDHLYKFSSFMKQTGEMRQIYEMKPPMRPLTDNWTRDFMNKNNLDRDDQYRLTELRKEIVRDHFRLQLWQNLIRNHSTMTSEFYTKKRVQMEYENDSVVWKCFYGKDKSDINIEEAKELYLFDVGKKTKEPEETDPAKKSNKLADLKQVARVVHFQMRLYTSARLLVLDEKNNPDLCIEINGLQFHFLNPSGIIRAHIQMLLKSLKVNIFNDKLVFGESRKKNRIFDTPQQDRQTQKVMISKYLQGTISHDRNNESFNIVDISRLYINLKVDTNQRFSKVKKTNPSFLEEYLPVITFAGDTPEININLGIPIITKLRELALGFATEERTIDVKQKTSKLKKNMKIFATKAMEIRNQFNKDAKMKTAEKNVADFNKLITTFSQGVEITEKPKKGQGRPDPEALSDKKFVFGGKGNHQETATKQNAYSQYKDYKQKKISMHEEEQNLTNEQKVDQFIAKLEEKLTKAVVKFRLNISPVRLTLRDHLNEELLKMSVDLGELELQVDQVYEQKNIIKCLGISMERFTGIEQKKTDLGLLRIFGLTVLGEVDKLMAAILKVNPKGKTLKEMQEEEWHRQQAEEERLGQQNMRINDEAYPSYDENSQDYRQQQNQHDFNDEQDINQIQNPYGVNINPYAKEVTEPKPESIQQDNSEEWGDDMMAHQTNQKPMANTGNNNQQQPQNYLDQGEDWDAYNQHQIGNSQQNQNSKYISLIINQ